jgi:hypothetical protein
LPPENHDPRAVSICKIIAAHCDQSGKIEYFKSGKKPHNLGRSEFFTDDVLVGVAAAALALAGSAMADETGLVGGAIAGGVVAGPVGAVAGAVIGNGITGHHRYYHHHYAYAHRYYNRY